VKETFFSSEKPFDPRDLIEVPIVAVYLAYALSLHLRNYHQIIPVHFVNPQCLFGRYEILEQVRALEELPIRP
jgi:hypothetical protein